MRQAEEALVVIALDLFIRAEPVESWWN
jgi:hypothetical protein